MATMQVRMATTSARAWCSWRTPRFNVLVETSTNRYQQVVGPARTEWTSVTYVSPGIRWAHNFASGLQVVPGIAFPIGIGSSAGERGIFLYLSLEAPLRAMYRK